MYGYTAVILPIPEPHQVTDQSLFNLVKIFVKLAKSSIVLTKMAGGQRNWHSFDPGYRFECVKENSSYLIIASGMF